MKNEHALLERRRAIVESRRAALDLARATYDRTRSYEMTARKLNRSGFTSPNGGQYNGLAVKRLLNLAALAGVE